MAKKLNYVFDTGDELYHWGILGQKWGHRRFQNEDGSLTPEGRERYGKSENPYKKEVKKYSLQKFKADIKSQKNKDKDTRHAKEERHRLKEWGKTQRLAKKEQAKIDKTGRPNSKIQSTKNMSDDDLQAAINRLKLQAEYNKQYTLATNPDGALAKADRFFEGPTGQAVRAIAVATIPQIANTAVTKVLESNLKYNNSLDKEKVRADIEKTKADTEKIKAQAKAAGDFGKKKANDAKASETTPQTTSQTSATTSKSAAPIFNTVKEASNTAKTVSDTVKTASNIAKNIMSSNKVMTTPITKISGELPAKSNISTARNMSVSDVLTTKELSLPVSQIAGYLPAKSEVLKRK